MRKPLERDRHRQASRNLNLLSLFALSALLIGIVVAKVAFDSPQEQQQETQQQPPPVKAETTTPPPPAAADTADKDQEKETERFVPSQKTSADNSATFPVDI